MFQIDWPFLLSMLAAVIVKLVTSPFHSIWRAIVTTFVALFVATIFTDPIVTWFSLDPSVYRIPMAALLTLTGEGLARFIIGLSVNPKELLDLVARIRGGK